MEDTYELTDLELMEVSFVDAGDDPLAKIAIAKRKEPMTEEVKEQEEVKRPAYKALYEEEQAKVEGLEADVEKLKQEIEDLKAEAVEKNKPAEETIEIDGEMVAKSAIPAPVLKKLEEVEKAQEKAALEKKVAELIPNAKGSDEVKAKIIKSLDLSDEEVLEFIRSLDAAFEGAYDEVGKGANVEFESPKDELDAMVKAYMDEHNVQKHKAVAEVTKSGVGRELLLKTQKKETK